MNIGDPIDPTPLICNNEDDGSNPQTPVFDYDDTVSMAPTLTDFHTKTNADNNSIYSPSWRHPISSTNAYLNRLAGIFTGQYLSWLAINNFALSGGVGPLLWSVGLPLFKELGIDAARQQLYMSMIITPFAIKPFIGVASDLFLIRGYNKRYLALFSIIVGLLGCSMLLVLCHTNSASVAVAQGPASVRKIADVIVACCFLMNLEGATLDILGEGKYSEYMRKHPESGSSIITFKFVWSLAGTILTQTYVGPLSDRGYFHVIFWIAFALLLTPFYPTFRGWIPEKKRKSDEDGVVKICCNAGIMFDKGLFQKKKAPFIAIALSGLAAPVMSVVSTYWDLTAGLVCSGFVIVGLAALTWAIFPRKVFRITIGMMLLMLCRVRLTSGLSYFYTADKQCLPDGKSSLRNVSIYRCLVYVE